MPLPWDASQRPSPNTTEIITTASVALTNFISFIIGNNSRKVTREFHARERATEPMGLTSSVRGRRILLKPAERTPADRARSGHRTHRSHLEMDAPMAQASKGKYIAMGLSLDSCVLWSGCPPGLTRVICFGRPSASAAVLVRSNPGLPRNVGLRGQSPNVRPAEPIPRGPKDQRPGPTASGIQEKQKWPVRLETCFE